jgi:hypothetical protein
LLFIFSYIISSIQTRQPKIKLLFLSQTNVPSLNSSGAISIEEHLSSWEYPPTFHHRSKQQTASAATYVSGCETMVQEQGEFFELPVCLANNGPVCYND